jgi:hypothetical protein
MSLRLRAFPDHGLLVWFALSAGVAAWAAHLTSFAVFVEVVRTRGWFWLFHLGNAAAILLTLVALALSWVMFRAGDPDEEAGTPGGRIRFLGALGLLLNAVNLLLIVVEGSYIFAIPVHHA